MKTTPGGALGHPQMILIDLDGTLIDTVPDLAYAVDRTLERLGIPPRGEPSVRQWVGNGPERMLRRALINSLEGEPDEALFQRAYPIFLEIHAENICNHSRLFPGVTEALDFFDAEGYRVCCVTNKIARFTEPLLEALDVRRRFALVISGDSLPKQKPDPMPLLHAAAFFGADPHRCLMVGDSINDVRAARAAGFKVACVTYGYNHGHDIREAESDAVMDSMAELKTLLEPRDAATRQRVHEG